MRAAETGWFVGPALPAGTDYAFSLDDGPARPDPRSAWQPHGVHGPSRTFDSSAFTWPDDGWAGCDARGAVAYELHVGTFTDEGTLDSAIDRLEVRGRDSAGLHVFVWGHDIETDALATLLVERGTDPLFQSGSVVQADECLSFVYKAAAEIGELGDNTAALRRALSADALLRRALQSPGARVAILGHTRWASVGIISEPNTHPLNSFELEQPGGAQAPYVVAALNGDVDNHADLRVAHGLRIASTITVNGLT